MRSKAPLALMEQVVMVLVFALATALCLQVFVFSNQVSKRNAAIDHAVLDAKRFLWRDWQRLVAFINLLF